MDKQLLFDLLTHAKNDTEIDKKLNFASRVQNTFILLASEGPGVGVSGSPLEAIVEILGAKAPPKMLQKPP